MSLMHKSISTRPFYDDSLIKQKKRCLVCLLKKIRETSKNILLHVHALFIIAIVTYYRVSVSLLIESTMVRHPKERA